MRERHEARDKQGGIIDGRHLIEETQGHDRRRRGREAKDEKSAECRRPAACLMDALIDAVPGHSFSVSLNALCYTCD